MASGLEKRRFLDGSMIEPTAVGRAVVVRDAHARQTEVEERRMVGSHVATDVFGTTRKKESGMRFRSEKSTTVFLLAAAMWLSPMALGGEAGGPARAIRPPSGGSRVFRAHDRASGTGRCGGE